MLPLLAAAACHVEYQGSAASGTQPARPTATVEEGVLRGTRASDVTAFLGVPYAMPPTGARRWRPSLSPAAWQGERDATRFGPACPQGDGTVEYYRRAARRLGRDPAGVPGVGATSEDCLYLNVWTPATPGKRQLPVFVWVHGGAGTSGSGADPLFNGEALARNNLVVVTLNYRLGALGFLAHPALSADDPRGVSGNYALHDIVQALRWIGRNAGAFGGDPARITVAGQSAGASLLEVLMTTPAAEGLFHRVVSQSATWLSPRPLRAEGSRETGEAAGVRFVAHLDLADPPAAALRALPVDALLAASARAGADAPSTPVLDGQLLVEDPAVRWARGDYLRVPLIKGSADDEFALFMPPTPIEPGDYRAWVEERFGRTAADVLAAYPPAADSEGTRRTRIRLLSDEAFRAPAVRLLDWTAGRSPMWLYRFAWRPGDGAAGAFHSIDLPFLFGIHDAVPWWQTTPAIEAITGVMQGAWARFAAEGEPNGPGLPHWPRAFPASAVELVIDANASTRELPFTDLLRRFWSD